MSHPIAVGIDLVTIARIQRLLDRKGPSVLGRLLTADEEAYCRSRPVPARHAAARIAAKEAAYKALQGAADARGIGWKEMEVVRDWDGRPGLRLHGRAERRAAALGVGGMLLSITHTDEVAAAMVVLLGGG